MGTIWTEKPGHRQAEEAEKARRVRLKALKQRGEGLWREIEAEIDCKSRRALLEAVRRAGSAKATRGPSAARSQDFLYGDDGLPK